MYAASVAVLVALSLTWLWWARRFTPLYAQWLGSQSLHAVALGLVLLITAGMVGSSFGLSNLFWHEDWLIQLVAGGGIGGLALFLWALIPLVGGDFGRPAVLATTVHPLIPSPARPPFYSKPLGSAEQLR